MPDNDGTCETCRFWEPNGPDDLEGACKRYPPTLSETVLLSVIQRKISEGYGTEDAPVFGAIDGDAWFQPSTTAGDWCGEHRPT